MKLYLMILLIILVLVIALGIWYCIAAYNKQSTSEKGVLVQERYAEHCIY